MLRPKALVERSTMIFSQRASVTGGVIPYQNWFSASAVVEQGAESVNCIASQKCPLSYVDSGTQQQNLDCLLYTSNKDSEDKSFYYFSIQSCLEGVTEVGQYRFCGSGVDSIHRQRICIY